MPRRAASLGPWIETGVPSKEISPESIGWIPAIDLISVDLPAPLSPTSAMISPGWTTRSTSVSACTEPKCFDTPRSSSVGVPVFDAVADIDGDSIMDQHGRARAASTAALAMHAI